MDNRYLVVGFLFLILGLFYFLYAKDNNSLIRSYFTIIPILAIFNGIVLIFIGVLDSDKHKIKMVRNKKPNNLNYPI